MSQIADNFKLNYSSVLLNDFIASDGHGNGQKSVFNKIIQVMFLLSDKYHTFNKNDSIGIFSSGLREKLEKALEKRDWMLLFALVRYEFDTLCGAFFPTQINTIIHQQPEKPKISIKNAFSNFQIALEKQNLSNVMSHELIEHLEVLHYLYKKHKGNKFSPDALYNDFSSIRDIQNYLEKFNISDDYGVFTSLKDFNELVNLLLPEAIKIAEICMALVAKKCPKETWANAFFIHEAGVAQSVQYNSKFLFHDTINKSQIIIDINSVTDKMILIKIIGKEELTDLIFRAGFANIFIPDEVDLS